MRVSDSGWTVLIFAWPRASLLAEAIQSQLESKGDYHVKCLPFRGAEQAVKAALEDCETRFAELPRNLLAIVDRGGCDKERNISDDLSCKLIAESSKRDFQVSVIRMGSDNSHLSPAALGAGFWLKHEGFNSLLEMVAQVTETLDAPKRAS